MSDNPSIFTHLRYLVDEFLRWDAAQLARDRQHEAAGGDVIRDGDLLYAGGHRRLWFHGREDHLAKIERHLDGPLAAYLRRRSIPVRYSPFSGGELAEVIDFRKALDRLLDRLPVTPKDLEKYEDRVWWVRHALKEVLAMEFKKDVSRREGKEIVPLLDPKIIFPDFQRRVLEFIAWDEEQIARDRAARDSTRMNTHQMGLAPRAGEVACQALPRTGGPDHPVPDRLPLARGPL
jgi:hypothetical protein